MFGSLFDLGSDLVDIVTAPVKVDSSECLKVEHEIPADDLTISNIALNNYGDVILPEYSDVSEIKEFMETAMDAYVKKSNWITNSKYDIGIDWNLLPKANKYGK